LNYPDNSRISCIGIHNHKSLVHELVDYYQDNTCMELINSNLRCSVHVPVLFHPRSIRKYCRDMAYDNHSCPVREL